MHQQGFGAVNPDFIQGADHAFSPQRMECVPQMVVADAGVVGDLPHGLDRRKVGANNTPEWNQATITQLFYDLAATGRFALEGLTSHVFKPEQCAEAYATANRDRASTMGILFDWTSKGALK